jgi:hypothetical protein
VPANYQQSVNLASPYSTGGGGSDLEHRVGASYLAAALCGVVPRGQPAGITTTVNFQRLYEGHSLDDIVVYSTVATGEAKLALQIKRNLAIGEDNPLFADVMRACWLTYMSPLFNYGVDRFGIVVGLYGQRIDEYYQTALTWARNSNTADDFMMRTNTPRLCSQWQRNFVNLIHQKLNESAGYKVSDVDLWKFLRSMVILHFDFQNASSRDYAYAVANLGHVLRPENRDRAADLFSKLVDYASEGFPAAASFDADELRRRLGIDGYLLTATPNCQEDIDRLQHHAHLIIDDVGDDIGGISLDRVDIVAEAFKLSDDAHLLSIIGPPGVGKSAILKAVMLRQAVEGPVIALSWDRIEGRGWDSFASHLQLSQPLDRLLVAISNGSHPMLFIDGADRILDTAARKVVTDLLHGLERVPLSDDGSRHWTVALTTREENESDVYGWLNVRRFGPLKTLRVLPFTSDEVKVVAVDKPWMRSLIALDHLATIIFNPFFLSLIDDHRMRRLSTAGLAEEPITEADVSDVWWEDLVGRDGVTGRERQMTLMRLGEKAIAAPGRRLWDDSLSADALESLESDRIVLRDRGRNMYRFGHDLLEDWVLYRVLDRHREGRAGIAAYLRDQDQPLGLYRPLQLLATSLLERDSNADAWNSLIARVGTAGLAARWRQAVLTAPLTSTRVRSMLDKAEAHLLADDGTLLIALLTALRTLDVAPNLGILGSIEAILDEDEKTSERVRTYLLQDPIPRWSVWRPTIEWLLSHADHLPIATRSEVARVMELWQRHAPPGSLYRGDIARVAFMWLDDLIAAKRSRLYAQA